MNILGISAGFHDAAAAVVSPDGEILFAGHSERYSKKKNDENFCTPLIRELENYNPIDTVAYDGTPYEEVLAHIGKNGFDLLWKTLNDIGKIADRNRYILDLHGGNFMLGRDSQIVISDPFYLP